MAFAASSLLAHRHLLGLAFIPLLAGLFYWHVALTLLQWRSPGWIFLDNVPLVWIAGISAVSAVVLAICGWVSLRTSTRQEIKLVR